MQFKIKSIRKTLARFAASAMIVVAAASTAFGDGLPGEYYITQRWRDLFAPYSPASNPALLTEENYVAVRGIWSPSLGNAFFLYETGAVVPMGLYQSVGFTVLGVTSNEPIRGARWDEGTNQIVFMSEEYYDNHMLLMASYAINPFNKLSFGANVNYYRTPNFGDAIQGLALDVGATYRLANHPVFGEHIVGFNLQNAISPNIFSRPEGESITWSTQSINAKVNWLGYMFDRQINAGIDFDLKDFTSQAANFAGQVVIDDDGNPTWAPGGSRKIEFDFSGRVGFWLMRMLNVYGHFGTGHWGISGGMNVPSIFGGRDFQAAYQYTNITDDRASFTHTIYFRGQFGPHREEVFARRMARQVQLGPGRLYNQMLSEHYAGNFWNSFFLGGRILTEFPDFFRNDFVMLYMSMNMEGMDMREGAAEGFNQVLDDFPRSPIVPHARLGLLRIAYRDGDFATVTNLYNQINVPTTADSIRQAAAYYQAEVLLTQNRVMEAIQLFDMIPPGHYDYVFAQHSIAVAYAINGNMQRAIEHLDNAVQAPARNADQRSAVERSYLLMAFLYLEGGLPGGQSLSRAVAALRAIPAASPHRAEALLGQAWVALQAANRNDVLSAARALQAATRDPILLSEADLLIGYMEMAERRLPQAITALESAQTRLDAFVAPTDREVKDREGQYRDDRSRYNETATRARELAGISQSSYVISLIDSLAPVQRQGEASVRSFGRFMDEHESALFFGREHSRVADDVMFALAKAREIQGAAAGARSAERLENIDDEMRRLQEQLRMLEER